MLLNIKIQIIRITESGSGQNYRIRHCAKNNLNLCRKTEPGCSRCNSTSAYSICLVSKPDIRVREQKSSSPAVTGSVFMRIFCSDNTHLQSFFPFYTRSYFSKGKKILKLFGPKKYFVRSGQKWTEYEAHQKNRITVLFLFHKWQDND